MRERDRDMVNAIPSFFNSKGCDTHPHIVTE